MRRLTPVFAALLLLAGCTAANNNAPKTAAPTVQAVATIVATASLPRTATATTAPPASVTAAPAAQASLAVQASAAAQTVTAAPTVRAQTTDSAPCLAGQIKADSASMIYHSSGGRDYARTKNNVVCFDTPAHAQAAGYRSAQQ